MFMWKLMLINMVRNMINFQWSEAENIFATYTFVKSFGRIFMHTQLLKL